MESKRLLKLYNWKNLSRPIIHVRMLRMSSQHADGIKRRLLLLVACFKPQVTI